MKRPARQAGLKAVLPVDVPGEKRSNRVCRNCPMQAGRTPLEAIESATVRHGSGGPESESMSSAPVSICCRVPAGALDGKRNRGV